MYRTWWMNPFLPHMMMLFYNLVITMLHHWFATADSQTSCGFGLVRDCEGTDFVKKWLHNTWPAESRSPEARWPDKKKRDPEWHVHAGYAMQPCKDGRDYRQAVPVFGIITMMPWYLYHQMLCS